MLKKNGLFFCPVCKEQVILKAGTQKILHFSHQKSAACSINTEPESYRHMRGKRDLYAWLLNQDITVKLEEYLPKIKQRPDILFKKNGQWFALEYQCSPISLSSLNDRTLGYRSCHIEPVWILGGEPLQQKSGTTYQINDFHWLFIQANENDGLFLISYSPEDFHFHILRKISPISSRKIKANHDIMPLESSSFPIKFPIKNLKENTIDVSWFLNRRKWVQTKLFYGKAFQDPFLQTMYQCNLHPLLLPPIIGIPIHLMGICKTHPVVWQFYIWYDSLKKLKIGEKFSFKQVLNKVETRAVHGFIGFRELPFVDSSYRKRMIYNYLTCLSRFSYLKEVGKGIFILNKTIHFPKNMEEVLLLEKKFLLLSRD